jgi:hypothetical protein
MKLFQNSGSRAGDPPNHNSFFLPMLTAGFARARTPTMENEFWPKVNVSFELRPQTRLRCMSSDKNITR